MLLWKGILFEAVKYQSLFYLVELYFFKETSILFSIVAAPIYIATNSVGGFPRNVGLLNKRSDIE